MSNLKDITLFLLDMDGTVNLGYDPIDGAKEFLEELAKYYNIEIFTVRNKIITVEWLKQNKIDHLIKEVSNVKNQFDH